MSIILKGIDLPKNQTITIHYANRYGEMETIFVDESDIIQIPKGHGRLIDANKYLYYGDLVDEPTILEAEETDEFDIERD